MPHADDSPGYHRFFCPTLPSGSGEGPGDSPGEGVSDAPCPLDRTESHHARNVLRLSAGAAVQLFDGRGTLAHAVIDRYDAGRAICRVTRSRHDPPITPLITVASAVPKGPRAEAMVDQLSQLGVDRFIPLAAEHSVAVPRPAKVEKFERLAIESAKQCKRLWLMEVEPPSGPASVWGRPEFDLKLIASPAGEPLPGLGERLREARSVLVLIGPEGGWSRGEVSAAEEVGCRPWSIAPNVLRIESAAACAAAILRYLTLAAGSKD